MKNNFDGFSKIISEFNSIIVFISFMIIYYYIIFESGVFSLVFDLTKGAGGIFKYFILMGLIMPLIFGSVVMVIFTWSIFSQIEYYAGTIGEKTINTFFSIAMLIGAASFIILISSFVAFQSNNHIDEISPQLIKLVKSIFNNQ